MAERLYRVELTANFLGRLDAIEAFLVEAEAGFAFDALLAELIVGERVLALYQLELGRLDERP